VQRLGNPNGVELWLDSVRSRLVLAFLCMGTLGIMLWFVAWWRCRWPSKIDDGEACLVGAPRVLICLWRRSQHFVPRSPVVQTRDRAGSARGSRDASIQTNRLYDRSVAPLVESDPDLSQLDGGYCLISARNMSTEWQRIIWLTRKSRLGTSWTGYIAKRGGPIRCQRRIRGRFQTRGSFPHLGAPARQSKYR